MEDIGVIVKQNQPTPWVNSMVTVLKRNGKLRICIDPRDLNKAIQREHYPLKTIEDVVQGIPEAKVFSKLDATSGFWQIALDSDSSKLCTFNTPFGRYSFTRLPFGIKSASEVYQKTISEMVQDIDGCEAIIDDILIWGRDMQEHDARLHNVMKRVSDYNLKLSPEKCQFRNDRVSYVGHVLTSEGVKPDFEKVRAVQEMEAPRNVSELQTFMGFITYLAKFLPNLSEVSAPLRSLLQKEVEWHWDSEQENSFRRFEKACNERSRTQLLRSQEAVSTYRRREFQGTWCRSRSGGSSYRVCVTCTYLEPTELCPNRKRGIGYRIWLCEISPVHYW